jgi:hypothetical protein
MRRKRTKRLYYRPILEVLEARCVPAAVFGAVLQETFDDRTSSLPAFSDLKDDGAFAVAGTSADDIGRITTLDPVTGQQTFQLTHPVFHHEFGNTSSAELDAGGTTVPTAPQDSAACLRLFNGGDRITFPDVHPNTEGVIFAALDVSLRDPSFVIVFRGANGFVSFNRASLVSGQTTSTTGSNGPPSINNGAPPGPAQYIAGSPVFAPPPHHRVRGRGPLYPPAPTPQRPTALRWDLFGKSTSIRAFPFRGCRIPGLPKSTMSEC